MENLLFIVLAFAGFVIIQSVIDSYHDHCIKEEEQCRDLADKCRNEIDKFDKVKANGLIQDLKFQIEDQLKWAKMWSKRWHRLDALNKGLSWVVLSVAITLGFGLPWWWMIILTVFAMPIRWNIFDPVYNMFRKMPLLYIGSVSDTDSISKKPYLMLIIKLGWLGLMIGIMFWA